MQQANEGSRGPGEGASLQANAAGPPGRGKYWPCKVVKLQPSGWMRREVEGGIQHAGLA